MAGQILLVRHATLPAEYKGHYIGRTDVPADPLGLRALDGLAVLLAKKKPEKCYCSPLLRTQQTAGGLLKPLGLQPVLVPDLMEVNFGKWDGLSFDQVTRDYPEEMQKWTENADHFAFPEGESVQTFMERIGRVADRLSQDPAQVVLAVTHAGVIRGLICHFLQLPFSSFYSFAIQYASCTTLLISGDTGALAGLNERC